MSSLPTLNCDALPAPSKKPRYAPWCGQGSAPSGVASGLDLQLPLTTMAGDWIKVQTNLRDNPKVAMLAEEIGIHPTHALGLLVVFWSWADRHLISGNAHGVTEKFIDDIVDTPGFAAALRKIGWLAGENPNLVLPNFEEHNGQTAKKRALTARRNAAMRSRSHL